MINKAAAAMALHAKAWGKSENKASLAGAVPLDNHDRLMLVGLETDLKRLSSIQSHQKRDELKCDELLERYRDYLNQLLHDNNPRTPEIVFWNMTWAIDAEQVEWGIELGKFAIAHDIETPERFRRDIRNVFVGDLSRLALKFQKKNCPSVFILDVLLLAEEDDWDLVDEISADLFKASASAYETAEDYVNALKYYEKASDTHPRSRVQRSITRLQKKLERQNKPQAASEK